MSKSFEENDTRVGAFGERLRRERELRGISLDEIAASTKIGTRLLRALEEEQFDLLPGGIFNKGYVRAYARHLGIDEEQAVADYLKAANERPPDVSLIARQNASARAGDSWLGTSNASYRGGFPMIPVLILVVVIVGAAGGWRLYQQQQRERRQSHATNSSQGLIAGQSGTAQMTTSNSSGNSAPGRTGPTPAVSPPENAGVSQVPHAEVHTVEAAESSPQQSAADSASGTSVSTGNAGPEGSAPFEVTIRAKDRARVEIKSDGKVLVRGVMNATDVKTIHATRKVVFWTANAGDVELSFNGKNIPLNSGENDEQVLVFNSHGLLQRPPTQ